MSKQSRPYLILVSSFLLFTSLFGQSANADTVERPYLSIEGGQYLQTQYVKISCPTAGADLFYTTDGQVPTQSSLAISNDSILSIGPGVTNLRIKGFKPGWTDSETKSAIYQIGPKVAAQLNHSFALDTIGNLWSFGLDDKGQLGHGVFGNSQSYPLLVQAISGVSMVAVQSASSSIVLKSDSTVWTWGYNLDYELGNGTSSDRSTPGQIPSFGSVKFVAAGYYHGFAIKGDGTLWAWGKNSTGQLGDSTTVNRSTPVQINALSDVFAVSGGGAFSMALKRGFIRP